MVKIFLLFFLFYFSKIKIKGKTFVILLCFYDRFILKRHLNRIFYSLLSKSFHPPLIDWREHTSPHIYSHTHIQILERFRNDLMQYVSKFIFRCIQTWRETISPNILFIFRVFFFFYIFSYTLSLSFDINCLWNRVQAC